MLEQVKLALRIKTDVFDSELFGLIEAAKQDLIRYGLKAELFDAEPYAADIEVAIISYCKARFGSSSDAERWEAIYQGEKTQLGVRTEYRG